MNWPAGRLNIYNGDMMRRLGRRCGWLLCWAAGTAVVVLGVSFGRAFVKPCPRYLDVLGRRPEEPFISSFVHWDGAWYRRIVEQGYEYDRERQSSVHFFPLYPVVAWYVRELSGCDTDWSLVLVSQVCFALSLWLLDVYSKKRYGGEEPGAGREVVLAASFLPAGLFFRVAYSESLFLVLCLWALYLVRRGVRPAAVAAVAGLATAARPVGVALMPVVAVYVWRFYGGDRRRRAMWTPVCLTLSSAGLLAFAAFCYWQFGHALAFADNMSLWYRRRLAGLGEKALRLGVLEPVWEVFLPGSPSYWGRASGLAQWAFSLYVANPWYFVAAVVAVAVGAVKRWLDVYELVLAAGLLLIPYWFTGYEVEMEGMGRYVSVVVPFYLVLGQLLSRLDRWVVGVVVGLCVVWLGCYASLFAQWYNVV